MITEYQKLDCIKFAKNLAVKMQSYEAAASLRDSEKILLNSLRQPDTYKTFYPDIKLESFNIEQLHFLNDLIKKSFKNDVDIVTEIIELRRSRVLKDILE
jgi:hypothetical protein